jgi:hypothetical protein
MNSKKILATIAISGAVATFALLNVNSVQSGKTFLATPMTDAEREFITFVSEHRRSYGTKEEYAYRLSLFAAAYEKVLSQDTLSTGITLAVNKFADMSSYEFKQMLGYKKNLRTNKRMVTFQISDPNDLPDEVDWVANGGVVDPKDQGQCGSCWAFSAVGSLEGANYLTTGNLVSLSEQQFVDCAFLGDYGNLGCSGGLMDSAFDYAKVHAIATEEDYSYSASRSKCDATKEAKGIVLAKSYTDVPQLSSTEL